MARQPAKRVRPRRPRKRATTLPIQPPPVVSERDLAAALARKIQLIAQACPEPPCTGVFKDQADEYPYTRSVEIFKTYHDLMIQYGLVLIPGRVQSYDDHDSRSYRVECQWYLVDVETGYSVELWSCGIGTNGIWSLQSATTIAKKQVLLMLFQATWPCEFEQQLQGRELRADHLWGAPAVDIRREFANFFEVLHREMQAIKGGKS